MIADFRSVALGAVFLQFKSDEPLIITFTRKVRVGETLLSNRKGKSSPGLGGGEVLPDRSVFPRSLTIPDIAESSKRDEEIIDVISCLENDSWKPDSLANCKHKSKLTTIIVYHSSPM